MSTSIKKIIKNPGLLFLTLGHRGFLNWMNDKTYLSIAFKIRMGKRLDLNDPQTYSEKLQWLKIYDRQPQYSEMVDKYKVKDYVASIIGQEYIIPTIGVWDKFEAMALGIPTISTDHGGGGARTLISSYNNGILIPIRDKEALAKAILLVINNQDLSEKISYNGQKIRLDYSIENIVEKWQNLILSLWR